MNNWENARKLISYSKGGITSKVIRKSKTIDVTLFCMAKGTEISEHTSTKKGIVFVLEGKGTFNLEGEKIQMFPGIIIFMEKNAVHSLKADENTSFVLLLFG